jgi:hypothetical protein
MRSDMAKVLVERPRWGSSLRGKKKGYRRSLQRTPMEDRSRTEPMAGRWRGMQKDFGEHLSPMVRFLRSNVGRPWNKVHQELCERVDFGNVVQKHILTHVFDYVAIGGMMVKGQLIFPSGTRHRCGSCREQLFVCARTGILRVARAHKRFRALKLAPAKDIIYLYKDCMWWEVRVRQGAEKLGGVKDVWFDKPANQITRSERIAAYGKSVLALAKRPLHHEETRAILRQKRRPAR